MNLFELFIKIGVDDQASGKLKDIGGKLGNGLKTAAKIGTAAVGAASAAIVALTTQAVNSFAEYEQLAGGAQKIFDKMDYSKIAADANNAYRELGLSANQYLSVINDVGATFAATMGDEAGYEAAKTGLKAISDYASGTGKNVDELSQKFTLITRSTSSYQSIADQFSGILPATSAGFLEQAQAAGILSDSYTQLTEVPIDEYQSAVSQMLEQGVKELGLYNNTMDEAFSTLTGSLSMAKGAWKNLVAGMADENANMEVLINNFVESAAAVAQNLLPRIEQTLVGIGELITALAPIVAEALPQLVESVLPAILGAAASLVSALINGIVTALPALYTALLEAVQIILVEVFGVSEQKASEFADGVNSFFASIKDGFSALVRSAQTDGTFLNEVWTGLQTSGQLFGDFLVALWDVISAAFSFCVEQINTEGTLLNTIWENIQTYITTAIAVINGVITAFTAVLQGDWSAAWAAVQSISQAVSDAVVSIISNMISWISGFLGEMVAKGTELIQSLQEGIANKFAELMTLVSGWVTDNIVSPILNMGSELYNAGVEILNQLWAGLRSVWNNIAAWWDGLTFSNKDVNVNYSGPPLATGLNYVPVDGFPAVLHRGEAVLTAAEAKVWRSGGCGTSSVGSGVVINQYINSVPQTPVELANATEAYFEQARWML